MAIVAFTEAPEPDTVKVVQTNRLGNRVDDGCIGHRFRENVGQVDVDEVDAASDARGTGATNFDEDQEDDGDEQEKGRDQSPCHASASRPLDLSLGGGRSQGVFRLV